MQGLGCTVLHIESKCPGIVVTYLRGISPRSSSSNEVKVWRLPYSDRTPRGKECPVDCQASRAAVTTRSFVLNPQTVPSAKRRSPPPDVCRSLLDLSSTSSLRTSLPLDEAVRDSFSQVPARTHCHWPFHSFSSDLTLLRPAV